jgi:hypothetical protein
MELAAADEHPKALNGGNPGSTWSKQVVKWLRVHVFATLLTKPDPQPEKKRKATQELATNATPVSGAARKITPLFAE